MGYNGTVEGCGRGVKYGMYITNGLILLGSLVVFGLGLWIIIDNSFANELLGTNLFAGAVYVLTGTALLSIATAVLGYFGAIREVKCLLLMYFIILFIIFVTMLIGGILGYVFREKVVFTMKQEMTSTIRLYDSRKFVKRAWDETQERLRCCGVDYFRDWKGRVPESCCKEIYRGQKMPCVSFPTLDNIYNDGCYNVTATYLQKHAAYISGAGIGLAFVMIFSLIFSCILFMVIK